MVIAAGIKPNAELARRAGLEVRRGIVVNDYMETSDPQFTPSANARSIEGRLSDWWRRSWSRAKCWRRQSPASRTAAFSGASSAAKLKIMGVEIFSAGSIDESEPGVETIRYEDPSLGIYKKPVREEQSSARRHPGRRYFR